MLNSKQKTAVMAAVIGASSLITWTTQSKAAVVINEIYGAGGGTTATTTYAYSQDFVELYNNGTSAVDLTGMKLEYGSATGVIGSNTFSIAALNSVTLAPLSYYLLAGAFATNAVGPTLTGADQTTVLSLAATAGKVELLAADGTTVLDLVGYGSTANGFEGAGPALGAGNTASVSRIIAGVDSNNNAADFAAGTPSPTGSASVSAVPEPATIGVAALASAMLLARRRR